MTSRWVTGWLQLAAGWRVLSFTATALLLLFLLWLVWWHPAQREQQRLAHQYQQQSQRYRQQLLALSAGPSLWALQQLEEQARLRPEPVAVPFSLPELLRHSGGTLEYWHPAADGSELAMQLQWPGFMALLNYLSSLRPVPDLPRFSLQRDAQQLRLIMEISDER
ncbi:HofO family protein [Erwinia persicina]|uniref:HofO family protein n=1 Tax=Erwinia persicina TaxID=55211 RepID=UPI00177C8214|nr:hypothetical protein [Erwinia persicina]